MDPLEPIRRALREEGELALPKPYREVSLAQRAEVAARRLTVLLLGAVGAFTAYGLVIAEAAGPWLVLAALQAAVVWKLPQRALAAVAIAALEVFLGVILPVAAISLALMGKPGFPLGPTALASALVLAVALIAAPWAITLLRDQDLRQAYVHLD